MEQRQDDKGPKVRATALSKLKILGQKIVAPFKRPPLTSVTEEKPAPQPIQPQATPSAKRAELLERMCELTESIKSLESALDTSDMKGGSPHRENEVLDAPGLITKLLELHQNVASWEREYEKEFKNEIEAVEADNIRTRCGFEEPKETDPREEQRANTYKQYADFYKQLVDVAYRVLTTLSPSDDECHRIAGIFDKYAFSWEKRDAVAELFASKYLQGEIDRLVPWSGDVGRAAMELIEKKYGQSAKPQDYLPDGYGSQPFHTDPRAIRVYFGSPEFRKAFLSGEYWTYGVVLLTDPGQAVFYKNNP